MFWRITHDTLKWLWPAIFAAFVAGATVAVGASAIWPGAKLWTEDVFGRVVTVLHVPLFWLCALVVFIVWLVALLWSGHKAGLEPARATPAAIQDRKQAVAVRPQRATDAVLEEYERLSKWAEADARVGRTANMKDRDTDVSHALGYAIYANWDRPVGYGHFMVIPKPSLEGPIERFREAALAGELRVWGRREPNGLFELIEPDFWEDNTLDENALTALFGQSKTIPFEGVKTDVRFYGIMVNRFEVESVWPHAG